jgi:hypothetical protein
MEEDILNLPPAVWVQIDLNARSRDGYVRARMSRARGPLVAGDENVIAYEPEDRVAAPARVIRIDPNRGFAYLDVNWAKIDDDTAYGWMVLPSFTPDPSSETNAASDVSMRMGFVGRLRAARFLTLGTSNSASGTAPLAVHPLVAL